MKNSISEKLLLLFCRTPGIDSKSQQQRTTLSTALDHLRDAFGPDFLDYIKSKRILDYGCGFGYQCVAMALSGAKKVVGVDISNERLEFCRQLASEYNVLDQTEFLERIVNSEENKFDLIISKNSFEHYPQPDTVIPFFRNVLREDGKILITFGPPWFAPYGSHMHFFTRVPFVNIIFPEKTVMRIRARYRSDGATRYEEVEGGLNKMTLTRFKRMIKSSGLEVVRFSPKGIRNLNCLTKIPMLNELLTVRIDCTLRKRS